MITVAALYIDPRGPYPAMPSVDCWDEARDARLYEGPHPVVAHPPCARWCRLAKFVEHQTKGRLAVGDDGGTFSSALHAVRTYGGVLEHPAWSIAWGVHGLAAPPARGWQRDIDGGWCCEVAQSAYGHRAQKLTWLYYVGNHPPLECDWSRPAGETALGPGRVYDFRGHAHGSTKAGGLKGKEAIHTPQPFADFLVALARRSV